MRLHGWSTQCVPGRDIMKINTAALRLKWLIFVGIAAALLGNTGCVTFTHHAVPASRLPHQFQAPSKCNLHPVNFQLLSSSGGKDHLLDSGDVVAITIQGILPPTQDSPPPLISSNQSMTRDYYPPLGQVNSPNFGFPFHVQADGTIQLPEIVPVHVRGLTLQNASQKIMAEFVKKDILKRDATQVSISLLKSRVNRVVVLREDASLESAAVIQKGSTILHKRGSGVLIDLPAKDSDVLHALAASGGLPGVDAHNDIWVLRQSTITEPDRPQVEEIVNGSVDPLAAIQKLPPHVKAVRIPLKVCGGEPIPFTSEDVTLHDGDIVFVEQRKDEYFYTGGLLPGGQIPLPRDEDLDIIEAIAIANGSVGGLGGTSSVAVLRAGAGLGNIIPPTRVLILRKLPNGQQLPIRVNLNVATRDPKERIKIMAGDYIMMYYKPGETAANAMLNFFNINLTKNID